MPNPNIVFPIIQRLAVTGHALFPGENKAGIDHTFEAGVTVIAGINGIGKTTLLNLIYRLLVGPFDPYKADEGVQLTQTRLTPLKDFNYFSRRDKAGSAAAVATGEFQFGAKRLSVTRSLKDLSIISLSVDGKPITAAPNTTLEFEIWSLSGCGSHYDFHLLIRSLVFFLETKTPVVWDPISQAELFRILFLDTAEAVELARLASEIQQIDSRRRNQVNQLNRYKEQQLRLNPDPSGVVEATQRAKVVVERVAVIDAQLTRLAESADSLERAKDSDSQKLDSLKLDLEEAARGLEHMHHQYFASLFPRLPEVARNVFLNLVGDSGCLVCGTRTASLSERFQQLATTGACPVCHSPKEQHEQHVQAAEFGSERIQAENTRVADMKRQVAELEASVRARTDEYREVLRARIELQSERDQLRTEADQLRQLLPASAEDRLKTENYIKVADEEIAVAVRAIRTKMDDYTTRMTRFRAEINLLRENLTNYFAQYAASFLAETCNLTYKPQKLLLGQAVEKVEYPTFAIQMTSAVSPSAGTTRTEFDDVSESQKEFIDLAFRMAVLRAYASATGRPGYAMIVIETPESSLDSIFVTNAGRMLRTWCNPDANGKSNTIVASSNLNRENMISALLGLGRNDAPHPTPEVVQRRIINLLKIAAENAALRVNRATYEDEFRKATQPEPANG